MQVTDLGLGGVLEVIPGSTGIPAASSPRPTSASALPKLALNGTGCRTTSPTRLTAACCAGFTAGGPLCPGQADPGSARGDLRCCRGCPSWLCNLWHVDIPYPFGGDVQPALCAQGFRPRLPDAATSHKRVLQGLRPLSPDCERSILWSDPIWPLPGRWASVNGHCSRPRMRPLRAWPRLPQPSCSRREAGVVKILVTGGCGFIGSAVCRHLVQELGHRGRQCRQADLCRKHGLDRHADREPALPLCQAGHLRPRRDAAAHARRGPSMRSCTSPRRAMSTARSTGRPPSSRPTSSAPSRCSRPRGAITTRGRAPAEPLRFHHVSTDEVYGDLPLDGGCSPRPRPMRPPRLMLPPRPPPIIWSGPGTRPTAFGVLSNCSNNYGPWHFPEEADPADDHQRARGQAAAGLWDRRKRAGLAACGGPRSRPGPGHHPWPHRPVLQHRRAQRAQQSGCVSVRSPTSSTICVR